MFSIIAGVGLMGAMGQVIADEAGTKAILDDWQMRYSEWDAAVKIETSPERKKELLSSPPDSISVARDLWKQVHKDLKKSYALPAVVWFLEHPDALEKAYPKGGQAKKIIMACLDALEKELLLVKGAGKSAWALSQTQDLRCRAILETMKDCNQNAEDQGLAALGLCLMMKEQGGMKQDSRSVMMARGQLLKDAIVKAIDASFGPVTVQDVVKEEIYELNNLSIGTIAPKVELPNTTQQLVSLPSGKSPVLLIFWDPNNVEAMKFLEKMMNARAQMPQLSVMPISYASAEKTSETLLNLGTSISSLVDDKAKAFKDFRVTMTPYVYLLDKKGTVLMRGVPDMLFDTRLSEVLKQYAQVVEKQQKKSNNKAISPPVPNNQKLPKPAVQTKPAPASGNMSAPPLRPLSF